MEEEVAMKRPITWILCASLALETLPLTAFAGVNIERKGSENPMAEVFKSTLYGALVGAVVGGAIVLAAQDSDANGDIMRWSIVGGTMLGLGAGIYFVARRPQPSGMLELKDGTLAIHPPTPQIEPGGGMSMRLVAVRF
jgi:hypothetical protein